MKNVFIEIKTKNGRPLPSAIVVGGGMYCQLMASAGAASGGPPSLINTYQYPPTLFGIPIKEDCAIKDDVIRYEYATGHR